MFPLSNPFTRDFYNEKRETQKVLCAEHHQTLVRKLLPDVEFVSPTEDRRDLDMLESGKVDFLIKPEFTITPHYSTGHNRTRFVAALNTSAVVMLTPDRVGLRDIADIPHYSCTVYIGVSNNSAAWCLHKVLSWYPKRVRDNIMVVHTTNPYRDYGQGFQVYFDITFHPDKTFRRLTTKFPSHLMSMHHINDGNYFIRDRERPFYKACPYFQKELIDLLKLQKQYPMLTRHFGGQKNDLYMPSIQSKYVLLTREGVDKRYVQDVLRKLLIQKYQDRVTFEGITVVDLAHISTAVPHHMGAKGIYKRLHLSNTSDVPSYYTRM